MTAHPNPNTPATLGDAIAAYHIVVRMIEAHTIVLGPSNKVGLQQVGIGALIETNTGAALTIRDIITLNCVMFRHPKTNAHATLGNAITAYYVVVRAVKTYTIVLGSSNEVGLNEIVLRVRHSRLEDLDDDPRALLGREPQDRHGVRSALAPYQVHDLPSLSRSYSHVTRNSASFHACHPLRASTGTLLQRRGPFGVGPMPAEGPRRSELSKLVTDHILGDVDRNVPAAVMDRDRVAHHLGEDG